jgi:hypothetical protein
MPITQPHLRSRATQDDILLAFADRLRTHSLLNPQTVVVSDQAVPEDMPGGGFCVVVAPGPGEFPGELTAAAHHSQVTEDGSVVVGIYTKILRDRKGRREFALFGRRVQNPASDVAESGRPSLIVWKREILKLLMVGEPTLQSSPGTAIDTMRAVWEPDDGTGIPLLRDMPRPVRSTGVLDVPGFPGWIGLQITFSIAWDWDLYA